MKTKTIILTIIATVALAIGITTVVLVGQPAPKPANQNQEQATQQTQNDNLVSFTAEEGKTVLDQLKVNATVEVKDSSYGPFVDSINGKKGGTDGKYWNYYVNGQMAQVGAGDYVTKAGDLVEWKFE